MGVVGVDPNKNRQQPMSRVRPYAAYWLLGYLAFAVVLFI